MKSQTVLATFALCSSIMIIGFRHAVMLPHLLNALSLDVLTKPLVLLVTLAAGLLLI